MRVFEHQVRTMPIVVPPNLLHFPRQMRQHTSSSAMKLWPCLGDRPLGEYEFNRRRLIPPFVVDSCRVAAEPADEVAGDSHADEMAYDDRRTVRLNRAGLHVLLACERLTADRRPSPQPSPGVPGEGAEA